MKSTRLCLGVFLLLASVPLATAQNQTTPKQVKELLAQLKAKDVEVRLKTVAALAELPPEVAVPALVGTLTLLDEDVRVNAVLALGKIGKPAVPALTKLFQHEDEEVRFHVVWALGLVGPAAKPALPVLVDALADPDSDVRRKAVFALVRVAPEDERLPKLLLKRCQDRDPDVRLETADALVLLDKRALPALGALLQDRELAPILAQVLVQIANGSNQEDTRRQAVDMVMVAWEQRILAGGGASRFSSFSAVELLGTQTLPGLQRSAKHPQARIRASAANMLGNFLPDDSPEAKDAATVLLRLMEDADPLVVAAACDALEPALGRKKNEPIAPDCNTPQPEPLDALRERTRPAFERALLADTWTVAHRALRALEFENDKVLQGLHKRFQTAQGTERIHLASFFADKNALAILRAALKHPESKLRHRAALALSGQTQELKIDPKEARTVLLPIFLESLQQKQVWQRLEAVQGLARLRATIPEALPPLLAALKDEDARVRQEVVIHVGDVSGAEDAKKILTALNALTTDPEMSLRLQLFPLLEPARAGAAGVPLLLRLLADEDAEVRNMAATGLAKLKQHAKEGVPALLKAALAPDTRPMYVAAIYNIEPTSFPKLLAALKDHDAEVRQALKQLEAMGKEPGQLVSGLVPFLDHADPKVSRRAAHALEQIFTILPNDNNLATDRKVFAARSLLKGLDQATSRYAKALKTGPADQRYQAALTLAQFNTLLVELSSLRGWDSKAEKEVRFWESAQKSLAAVTTALQDAGNDEDLRVRRVSRKASTSLTSGLWRPFGMADLAGGF